MVKYLQKTKMYQEKCKIFYASIAKEINSQNANSTKLQTWLQDQLVALQAQAMTSNLEEDSNTKKVICWYSPDVIIRTILQKTGQWQR